MYEERDMHSVDIRNTSTHLERRWRLSVRGSRSSESDRIRSDRPREGTVLRVLRVSRIRDPPRTKRLRENDCDGNISTLSALCNGIFLKHKHSFLLGTEKVNVKEGFGSDPRTPGSSLPTGSSWDLEAGAGRREPSTEEVNRHQVSLSSVL